jgi:hypothetical protein
MLDDVGVRAIFSHDGSDHILRRPSADLNPDKSGYSGAITLLMVRDPRDTVVSGYFQITRRLKIEAGSLSELLRDDRHGIFKICHFNLQWFAAGDQINRFAILPYEQLHKSPSAVLKAVASFAGMALDDRMAALVTSNRTFQRMRAAEASGELAKRYGDILLPVNRNDTDSFKVRRGLVGGYSDYLSAADLSYCEQILAKTDYWSRLDQAMSRWDVEQFRLPAPRLPGADGGDAVV